jgi:hypothetical protein
MSCDYHCLLLQQLVLEYYIETVLHILYFAGGMTVLVYWKKL